MTILIIGLCSILTTGHSATENVKKKILYIDSYHEGYPWSAGISEGVKNTLATNEVKDKVELKVIRMDTKRNTSEEFKKDAARKAVAMIDSWQPDVVIASDDNASKYVILPYFIDKPLPFVFCGVNWDASLYGFPFSNVTGMVEVSLVSQLIETMQSHASGKRVGLLGADNLSNRKEALNYKKILNIDLKREVFVNNFAELKTAFKEIQKQVDMLILAPPSFIKTEKEKKEARAFFERHTTIPTGSVEDWITPYSLVGYTKVASEQGEWATQTALKILGGKSPADIPIVRNKAAQLFLNMRIAKKMKIKFPMDMITRGNFVE